MENGTLTRAAVLSEKGRLGVLEAGDPYFNPNLSLDSPMFDPR